MQGKHILVIEDDAEVRARLAAALREAGLRVDLAGDGPSALEHLRQGLRPSVIVLDLRAPHLGCAEFLMALRADPRFEHVPVITMAGCEEAHAHGVHAHPHGPFDVRDLLGIVLSLTEATAA